MPREIATPSLSVLILRCLASSITLVTFTQRYKKLSLSGDSRDYVLNAILSPGVLQSLILLYPQYIARITYQNAYEDTLQLSTLYDRNSDIFCQLLLLLHHHASFTHMLTTSVPRPESLFTEYHLTLSVAAAILRSVLDSSEVVLQLVHSPLASLGDSNPWDITTPVFEETVKAFFPLATWSHLAFNGFLAFWLLQYTDLNASVECYAEYEAVIEKEEKEKEKEKRLSRSERSAARQIEELKKELKAVQEDEARVRSHVAAMEVSVGWVCERVANAEGVV